MIKQTLAQYGAEAGLDEAALQPLRDLARRIAGDPRLRQLAVAAHHAVFETGDDGAEAMLAADSAFGSDAGLLRALFVLDGLRLVRERQAARGIPPACATAVNRRHGGTWLREAAALGDIGSVWWNPGWLSTIAGGLYRLGRLEFAPTNWDYPFRVYRHRQTGAALALATAGLRFSDEGTLTGTRTWQATLSETGDAVTGTPITSRGVALRRPVRLPGDEWRLTLAPGDTVLDLHVPGEEALTIEALRDALVQAEPFFDSYYPERAFVAYVCDSWLFSPQLEALLGPDSNIVRWQHEGYLLPGDGGQADFLQFTFGAETIDTVTAPRDTRLRRAVIEHLDRDGTLQTGVFLLLRSDLARFGKQPYAEAPARAPEAPQRHKGHRDR